MLKLTNITYLPLKNGINKPWIGKEPSSQFKANDKDLREDINLIDDGTIIVKKFQLKSNTSILLKVVKSIKRKSKYLV